MAIPYPTPGSEAVSRVMRGNRKSDTGPERRLRSALHSAGLRFRKNVLLVEASVTVRADVIFRRSGVVVFVDGCFWRSCPDHGTAPARNSAYWGPKLARNVERDRGGDAALTAAGWHVVRVWEHEDASVAAARIGEDIRSRQLTVEVPDSPPGSRRSRSRPIAERQDLLGARGAHRSSSSAAAVAGRGPSGFDSGPPAAG